MSSTGGLIPPPGVEEAMHRATTERFLVGGMADDVVEAMRIAWTNLSSCMGEDDIEDWSLSEMTHDLLGLGKLKFSCIFERTR